MCHLVYTYRPHSAAPHRVQVYVLITTAPADQLPADLPTRMLGFSAMVGRKSKASKLPLPPAYEHRVAKLDAYYLTLPVRKMAISGNLLKPTFHYFSAEGLNFVSMAVLDMNPPSRRASQT